ncbi:hypothetical protein B0O80DRAFT_440063, partial [Mortierella sp. GBAus27b]
MSPLLKKLLNSKSPKEVDDSWENIMTQFPGNRIQPFIRYMEKNWLASEKRSPWVLYVRKDYQHVNTNNLLESWFRTLKEYHLERRRPRADFVIHMLQGRIESEFRVQYVKVRQGIQPVQLSQYDKVRKEKAMQLSLEEAGSKVTENIKKRKFMVKSFGGSGEEYSVAVDVESGLLLSCSCPDHTKHRIPCKHMYLISRVNPGVVLERRPAPMSTKPRLTQEKVSIDDQFGPPLEDSISPHLQNQLKAERERKKRERDEATAQAIRDCENELQDSWREMGRFVYGTGKRRCTLKDMQDASAAM